VLCPAGVECGFARERSEGDKERGIRKWRAEKEPRIQSAWAKPRSAEAKEEREGKKNGAGGTGKIGARRDDNAEPLLVSSATGRRSDPLLVSEINHQG